MKTILLICMMTQATCCLATFSIVAVDTVTREVGGAGASCINNSRIINDLLIGIGAIHTQSYYLRGNQTYANSLMLAGVSPDDIMDSLVAHDFGGNPSIRQYGLVDLTREGESAAFTGENCTDWAGHRVGPGYAIQGNILLSEHIVDTMEYAFTHTTGRLDEKLMAALEAAKIPGADTRCLPSKSAISAFVRVARVTDNLINPYLDLDVPSTSGNVDPIDVLRTDYDQWQIDIATSADPIFTTITALRDTLSIGGDTTTIVIALRNNQNQPLPEATELTAWTGSFADVSQPVYSGNGNWTCQLFSPIIPQTDTIFVFSFGGTRPIELRGPTVVYELPTTVDPLPIVPTEFTSHVWPNPFNSTVNIQFTNPAHGIVRVSIHDLLGREIVELLNENSAQGHQQVQWQADHQATGLYFVRITSASHHSTTKILLLK